MPKKQAKISNRISILSIQAPSWLTSSLEHLSYYTATDIIKKIHRLEGYHEMKSYLENY